ncbi:hypothetical protein F5Y15DRAFT_189801 [Xylariaceae sp. FL0016]|nr:hypothetical protein F5Y15DRAFT_189801 [Xylariaceae sp. FL0016]
MRPKRPLPPLGTTRGSKRVKQSHPTPGGTPGDAADIGMALDTSLTPIANVFEAFLDMIKKLDMDIKKILHNGGIHLRVATMCSGTEAPILSLNLIVESSRRLSHEQDFLSFDHLFSVEIEPFKQSYIARNAPGATVFRDVMDFRHHPLKEAPTALGPKAPVPANIDLLVAGSSCKDYSQLNSTKKVSLATQYQKRAQEIVDKNGQGDVETLIQDISNYLGNEKTSKDLGSSETTFFSILVYIYYNRPKTVILENVMNAPWGLITDTWFPLIGYKAQKAYLDTKDYYIPQTRSRGYVLAVDRNLFEEEKVSERVFDSWAGLVKKLKAKASVPAAAWLLPPNHPLTIRSRQEDANKALKGASRDTAWDRSRVRHERVRREQDLGAIGRTHPITGWDTHGQVKPYDRLDRVIMQRQPNRQLDCLDINQLRARSHGYIINGIRYLFDPRFKAQSMDISQNIDRLMITIHFGLVGCITPKGEPWITNQCRLVSGAEALVLQGLPVDHLDLTLESQDQLRDLAGNAMTTTAVGACELAMLIAINEILNGKFFSKCNPHTSEANDSAKELKLQLYRMAEANFCTLWQEQFNFDTVLGVVRQCIPRCCCSGAAKYSVEVFKKCLICNISRCENCAGNPTHHFGDAARKSEPAVILPSTAPVELARFFPTVIPRFVISDERMLSHYSLEDAPKTQEILLRILRSLEGKVFYYEAMHVAEKLTMAYRANNRSKKYQSIENEAEFELRCVLSQSRICWYLYLIRSCPLAVDIVRAHHLNSDTFERPFAKVTIAEDAPSTVPRRLSDWQLRRFDTRSVSLDVHCSTSGKRRQLRIALSSGHNLTSLPPNVQATLASLEGEYVHYPECAAAEDSLHYHKKSKLYLFKDPDLTTTLNLDTYIISEDCTTRAYHDDRDILVKFDNRWDPTLIKPLCHTMVEVRCDWILPAESLELPFELPPPFPNFDRLKFPSSRKIQVEDVHGSSYFELFLARTIRHQAGDRHMILSKFKGDGWHTVASRDMPSVTAFLKPMLVKTAGYPELSTRFEVPEADDSSQLDVPVVPKSYWIHKAGSRALYWTKSELTRFSDQLANQNAAFALQIKLIAASQAESSVPEGMQALELRYVVNPRALAHHALSHLPICHGGPKAQIYMESQPNAAEDLSMHFISFRSSLKELDATRLQGIPHVQTPQMFRESLNAFQQRSLNWMVARECNSQPNFTEKEGEDSIISDLNVRLFAQASRKILRRGGILADDVGYGKTAVCLALIAVRASIDDGANLQSRKQAFPDQKALKASLVIVPNHLLIQWAQETQRFLEIETEEIVTIRSTDFGTLDKNQAMTAKLQNAKIVLVSNTVFKSIHYQQLLTEFNNIYPLSAPSKATKPSESKSYAD